MSSHGLSAAYNYTQAGVLGWALPEPSSLPLLAVPLAAAGAIYGATQLALWCAARSACCSLPLLLLLAQFF